MVKEIRRKSKNFYICEICDVAFAEKEWAEKCQVWDEEHPGSCNLEIVKYAVRLPED